MVKVDMWCHFGHAHITKVDEGEMILLMCLFFAFQKRRGVLEKEGEVRSFVSVCDLRTFALNTKMNNDKADGHCYSFPWI